MRRSYYKILMLVLVSSSLLLPISVSAKKIGSASVDASKIKRFASVKEAARTYQQGLQQIFKDVPVNIYDPSHRLFQLSLLKREVYKRLFWGYIRADNRMISLGAGEKSGAWAVVFSFDHPELKRRGNTLTALRLNSISHVKIRPEKVSQRWAGIFMVHEMSHLFEYLTYGVRDQDSTEYYAYDYEKRALNYLTKNMFDNVLDRIIQEYKLQTHKSLHAMRKDNLQKFTPMLEEIESVLKEKPALSIAEREMRDGFYLMSLHLRISELNRIAPYARINKSREWLDTFAMFK